MQQDDVPKHNAKSVKNYIQSKQWKLLDHPPQSPDLNPIENLWRILDMKCKNRNCNTENELFEMLKSEWEKIENSTLEKLIDSMPSRCRTVAKSNGYATKY